jgi:osmotically-inducible protein OsmY
VLSAAPAKVTKTTISQQMGVTILKTLHVHPTINGPQISVRTTGDTVMLNGKVKTAAQRKLAEAIDQQKAKTLRASTKSKLAPSKQCPIRAS